MKRWNYGLLKAWIKFSFQFNDKWLWYIMVFHIICLQCAATSNVCFIFKCFTTMTTLDFWPKWAITLRMHHGCIHAYCFRTWVSCFMQIIVCDYGKHVTNRIFNALIYQLFKQHFRQRHFTSAVWRSRNEQQIPLFFSYQLQSMVKWAVFEATK